jgi:hypothetical protein
MLTRLWPTRRQQERLLRLGERKAWTPDDMTRSVGALAGWLHSQLGVPSEVAVTPSSADAPSHLPVNVPEVHTAPIGVGKGKAALGKLVAKHPKTLSNALSEQKEHGPREDRADHRWLRLLARLEADDVRADALVFHRRTTANVGAEIARRAQATLDAGDAILLLSLIALWQRRRPKNAKGPSRSVTSRRDMTKPVAAVVQETLTRGQLERLSTHALRLPAPQGRCLALVLLEGALTEAHLAPHRARRTESPSVRDGEAWLSAVDAALRLDALGSLLDDEDRAVCCWRVERMRAYLRREKNGPVDSKIQQNPHVQLVMAIERTATGEPSDEQFGADQDGAFMLIPQARRLGLLRGE